MTTDEMLSRLKSFALLEDGWDSYGGNKPSAQALKVAENLVESLFICPTSDGGIALTLGDSEEIEINISPEGKINVCFMERVTSGPRDAPKHEPECSCGYEPESGYRRDVVCPKHDGVFIVPPKKVPPE